jgi:hypothetical protein
MKIIFWCSDKPHERLLADAFVHGARALGDECIVRPLQPEVVVEDCDLACMVGVKSRETFWAHWNAKIHTLYFDKGYTRHSAAGPVKVWEYWRVSVDGHQPTLYFMDVPRPSDRFDKLGLTIKPWREPSKKGHIVIAGSSKKYHDFYGLSEPTRFARQLVGELRDELGTKREIVYRPKPSWKEAVPLNGTRYSTRPRTIEDELQGAHCLITHGSNACFEAVLEGVPCIILGEAVAKPISSTSSAELENPRLATHEERAQWFFNLAYCQWKASEFFSGEAWENIRPRVYG